MFRKLTDRLNSALSGSNPKVTALVNMGFDQTQAQTALSATSGDVERAAELLLVASSDIISHTPSTADTNRAVIDLTADDESDMMERAISNSLASEEKRIKNKTISKKKNRTNNTSAVPKSTKCNEQTSKISRLALTSRVTKEPIPSHKIILPPQMKDKSKEEQISRCAGRLSPHPRAVDTLLIALRALRDDPANPKFRRIDTHTPGYKQTLENIPGAEDLLLAMNFRRTGGDRFLCVDRGMVDLALLWMGIGSLENSRKSEEFRRANNRLEFVKTVREIMKEGFVSGEENAARMEYMKKLPREPDEGQNGTLLQVYLTDTDVRKRRFDGDDQVRDVFHWIGTFGSAFHVKIMGGEWLLMNKNASPARPISCDDAGLNKTLQWVGCWPSGRLELCLNEEVEIFVNSELETDTRGLGVATFS